MSVLYSEAGVFQSTPPVRGATASRRAKKVRQAFQSTPPVRGATLKDCLNTGYSIFQSTPPVRGATAYFYKGFWNFNPRPPCGGRPRAAGINTSGTPISIHAPRAGGDTKKIRRSTHDQNFNPRPPCGGRRFIAPDAMDHSTFQSTPPVRGATKPHSAYIYLLIFQSTPPVRGASMCCTSRPGYFNPRPPCGGRQT